MKQLALFTLVALSALAQTDNPGGIRFRSKVFIDAPSGFNVYLAAAFYRKGVPLTVVTEKAMANYEICAVSDHERHLGNQLPIFYDWLAPVIAQRVHSNDSASIELVDLQSSEVIYAYSVDRNNSFHGIQTVAESIAIHLRHVMNPGVDFK
jgi:hypothetical protein